MSPGKEPERKFVNLAFRLKPLIADANRELHFIRPVDIYTGKLDDADTVKLLKETWKPSQRLGEVTIDVPCGLREFYGPTAVQVLDQLPPDLRKKAAGYTVVIKEGMYSGEDMTIPARVVLYAGKLPDAVKAQPVIARGQKFAAPLPSPAQIEFAAKAQTAKPVQIMKPLAFKKPDIPGPAP